MHTLPGGLRTDQQPPTAIPLRHFVVALAFLVTAIGMGLVSLVASLPGLARPATLHALLLGWICLTIMGAMTQFVPVWSGVTLHSRRLATAQLWLVTVGLAGFVWLLLVGALEFVPLFATLILAGLWTFVYNVGRTLARSRPFDFTERHFAVALCSFAVVAPLGYALALDFTMGVFDSVALTRTDVILLHATLALFGGVLPTIVGALSQLGKMFTQATLEPIDESLQTLETITLPAGALLLAVGRGFDTVFVARIGALAVLVGAAAFAVVVVRLLVRATADSSPMTARYWIVAVSLASWIALTATAWWVEPIGYETLFGHPDATVLLVVGVFGFVVVGTLYHIVPFIIWHDRYSDRLGFEPVPMIDDLYSSRLERVDFWASVVGLGGIAASSLLPVPDEVGIAGGSLLAVGFALFVANMLRTIHRHGPGGLGGVLVSSIPSTTASRESSDSGEEIDDPVDESGQTSD
ncbi:hypothetical protein [Natronoglomus mannanivorans]|uniref:Cbb3-type cytochrome c oxidase subunit I n=1 Tax=Natronoglomus mannanivorans TaxID=2979990 RepID=A0AAP2YYC4_9EURY|nr:cbb3-type cytochrome c oxidase subunit I [Halobacteria archaeon AArc-xg1-1]